MKIKVDIDEKLLEKENLLKEIAGTKAKINFIPFIIFTLISFPFIFLNLYFIPLFLFSIILLYFQYLNIKKSRERIANYIDIKLFELYPLVPFSKSFFLGNINYYIPILDFTNKDYLVEHISPTYLYINDLSNKELSLICGLLYSADKLTDYYKKIIKNNYSILWAVNFNSFFLMIFNDEHKLIVKKEIKLDIT